MAGGTVGDPTYDTVGLMLIGHPGAPDTATIEDSSNTLSTMLEAGRLYRIYADQICHIALGFSSVTASTSDTPYPAGLDWILPKEDCYLAVYRGSAINGTLWVTPMYRYGE